MTRFKTGAAALAIVAAFAAAPALAADKVPEAFLQCDGRVGHVTDGARFARLLLITATAGISEAAMSKDDVAKRAKGAAGAAACDQAVASERDGYRRMQLALARPLHFGEDKDWGQAAAAAAEAPHWLGAQAGDWGLAQSSTSTARYLQAVYLVREGKIAEAEAAAWDGVRAAPMDVITLQRMARFVQLSRTMTPEKRAVLEAMQRYYPDSSVRVANAYAEAGDFKSAAIAVRGFESSFDAFIKDPKPVSGPHNLLASLEAMDGNVAAANVDLEIAKAALERERSEGAAASDPASFAAREEGYAFAEAATAAAAGNMTEAARMLGARDSWSTITPGMVAILVGRVASKVPENARIGILRKSPEAIWREALDGRLAVLNNSDKDAGLWNFIGLLEQDEAFGKLARNAASGTTAKPKWLVPATKGPRDYDILAAGIEAPGWEAGEGLLYHAALIAQARGKTGFVLFPKRDRLHIMLVRFVDPGDFGIPLSSMVIAADVIAGLSPHIHADQQ